MCEEIHLPCETKETEGNCQYIELAEQGYQMPCLECYAVQIENYYAGGK